GKISRYFVTPFFRGSLWVWSKTASIRDAHMRAGLRVGAIAYLGGIIGVFWLLAGHIAVLGVLVIIGCILFLLIMGLVLYFIGHADSSGEPIFGSFSVRPTRKSSETHARSHAENKKDSSRSSRGKRYAHDKAGRDYSKSGGQVNANPFVEFVHPTYDPP